MVNKLEIQTYEEELLQLVELNGERVNTDEKETKLEDMKMNELEFVFEDRVVELPTNSDDRIEEIKTKFIPFIDILQYAISPYDIQKYKIILSQSNIDLLLIIIKKYPEFFSDFESTMMNIIKDDKIDSNDIPDIILLLHKLYEITFTLPQIKWNVITFSEMSGSFIKLMIHVLVQDKKISISNEKNLLEQVDKLLDVCVTSFRLARQLKRSSFIKNCFERNN